MESTGTRIIFIFFDILLPLIAGYILRQKNALTSQQCNFLIRFNIIVIMTILTLLSFWILPLRSELLMLPFFSFFNAFLPWAIVIACGLYKRFQTATDRGSYIIAAIPSNVGALGGLCGYILYGEISFAYVQMVGIFQNLVMLFILFPMGYYYQHLGEAGRSPNVSIHWKDVFINWNQLSIVGIAGGMLLYAAQIPRPPVLGTVFQALVHISAWAALLPIGYLIEFSNLKQYYRTTLNLIPIKLLITPIASYMLASFFTSDPVLLGTLIIVMSTPCAINALITERLYGLNVNLAMAPFITTTIVYILILYPAFYLLVTLGWLPFK